MNITYLIGNGFDISCGLKTKYPDFLNNYLTSTEDDKDVCFLKGRINENLSTWADAEYAFGQLTQCIVDPKKFTKCFNHFLDNMAQYFSDEQKRMKYVDIKAAEIKQITNGLMRFQSTLCEESRKIVSDCIKDLDCYSYSLNFLVFNYTEVFEKVLYKCIPRKTRNIDFLDINEQPCHCKIDTFEYAHGSLKSLPLIFGVNDAEQIDLTVLRKNREITHTLIKPIENEATRALAFARCKEALKKSDIICLYGMSLGATDSMWWNMIIEWMAANVKANLIIHYWDPAFRGAGAGTLIKARDLYKGKFIGNAKTSIHMQKSLTDRIHVVLNANPFHISEHV